MVGPVFRHELLECDYRILRMVGPVIRHALLESVPEIESLPQPFAMISNFRLLWCFVPVFHLFIEML